VSGYDRAGGTGDPDASGGGDAPVTPLRILVVDDEPAMVGAVSALVGSAGHRVVTAYDGEAALLRFEDETPDLVLLDLAMPGLDGVEVVRRIRAMSRVPIIVLTGEADELAKVEALDAGADDYVTKPFGLHELLARVRALLRRSERQGEGALAALIEVGGVQVDLAGHQILRDGRPLPVKPKAFELLAFLIAHPGQVFTRDQLLERVWGYDYGGETRTVDVHVHWLRTVIEDDPATPVFLHTVRGVGYVFRRTSEAGR